MRTATPRYGLASALFKLPRAAERERVIRAQAETLLEALGLQDRWSEPRRRPALWRAQRRLEIARALATGARTLLLDEPAAGMNERETEALMHDLTELRRDNFR